MAQPVITATSSPTASGAGPVQTMPAVEVTGSRIKRLDVEGPSPVVAITSEEIGLTGFHTVGDVVRNLPFGNGTSVDPQFGTGLAHGATSFNLRGLGVNNLLVLVNGRRAAPYGFPGGLGFTPFFDFNSLPLAAIDRVEILKDGASAIYGSDAVAGVVNIKLRENFRGLAVSAMYGNTFESDSALQNYSLTFGGSLGATSLLFVADWQTRNAMFLRDRELSRSADGRRFGGQDARSGIGFPAAVNVPARDAAGRTPPSGTITGMTISPQGSLLTTPRISDFSSGPSLYDFNADITMIPDYTYAGFYTRVRHEFSSRIYGFAEASLRQNTTFYEQAAAPVTATNEQGTATNGGLRLPFNNPYNPFGVDIDNFSIRLVPLGRRTRRDDSTTRRFLAGLNGKLGSGDWTYQGALLHAKNSTSAHDDNSATDAGLQSLLNNTTVATAFNPFGPSAPGVVESLRTTLHRNSVTQVRSGDVEASGTVMPWRAGNLGLAVGAEYRRESLADKPDLLVATGRTVASGGGAGVTADRRVQSFFAELSLPLTRSVELQLAGRHESYSDFGTADKPKLGAKWRAAQWLVLRGAFSQSFRAPDLTQLFASPTISFTQPLRDPLRPNDPVAQIRQVSGGNSKLRPEDTNSYYLGALFEIPRVKDLEISVDLWRFMRTDEISTNSIDFVLGKETTAPTGFVVRNAPTGDGLPGVINVVHLAFLNLSRTRTEGIDLALKYSQHTEIGTFSYNAALTHTHSFLVNNVESIRSNGYPQLRGSASLQWMKASWSASVHGTYLDGYAEPAASSFGPGKLLAHRIGNHYVFNPQVSYSGVRGMKITLGVKNVFDRDPPHAFNRNEQYDVLQVNNEGRFAFVRVSKTF